MCGLIFLSFGGEDVADYVFRTLEDRQKIEKLWEDGRTPKEISETTGVSVHEIMNMRSTHSRRPAACGTTTPGA